MMDKTVSDIIEEVRCAVCDDYCKWPEIYEDDGRDEDALLEEKCNFCPLDRL